MGNKGTYVDRERWSLKRALSDTTWIVAICVTTIPFLVMLYLGVFDDTPFRFVLVVLSIPLSFCFAGLVVLAWNGRVFHDYAYMSLREFPLEVRQVETAVGLLLMSREARFGKDIRTWRFRTRMQVVYRCHKMDDKRTTIEVRPVGSPETEWTQVRLFHDMEEAEERRALEDAIDHAVANPFELKLKKYHLEKEPELHMWKGGHPPQDQDVE